jgi:ubiquinone/menaquinone biosynthesis C-methylase UbiE
MLYEDQAASFDRRAGIPAAAIDAIARAVAAMAGLEEGKTLLEIGAGTGMLSLPLLRWPIRYIGFDRSPAMLDVFRERLAATGRGDAELLVADGNARWPARDGSVDIIFSSRALHHLDVDHAVAETERVLGASGGMLIAGRVRRPDDSVKSVLRRQMRRLLKEAGYAGRGSERSALFAMLEERGATPLEPVIAARWTVLHRPADSLAAWEGKSGLAGIEIDGEQKADLLADLRERARELYGDLDRELEQEELFELSGVRSAYAS